MVNSKSRLYEICAANHWEHPLFECCNEQGPDHKKLFTFKVTVEIILKNKVRVLECYGSPQSRKKKAAEHAAEAALWYLGQEGHN